MTANDIKIIGENGKVASRDPFPPATYSFEEDSGETAGGSKILISTKVFLFETNTESGAYIVRDGFQTNQRLWGKAEKSGDNLVIYFSKCASKDSFPGCGEFNAFKVGENILIISKNNSGYSVTGSLLAEESEKSAVEKKPLKSTRASVENDNI